MTIRHLRIFVRVYQLQSITQAAEALHLTQPAVSRAIAELESCYSLRLFERMNHRLYRTAASDEFYASALHIVDSFDRLERGARGLESAGTLRVGASLTLGSFFLPDVLRSFQAAHPDVSVRVTVSNTAFLAQALRDDALDLAVIEGAVNEPHLRAELLRHDRMQLIVPPGHALLRKRRILLSDVLACPLLLRESGSAGRAFLDGVFASRGAAVQPAWESASTQALIRAVAAGLGVSILPEQLVSDAIESGTVAAAAIADVSLMRENFILYHREKYFTRAARALIAAFHAAAE